MLALFSTCLHSVHSMLDIRLAWRCLNKWVGNLANVMLGLQLAWLRKVYRKPEILFYILCTSYWIFNLLGGVLINVWVNLANVMLGLRLAWLSKVHRKPEIFFYILCTLCRVSDLLDFTKEILPFLPKQIINQFFFSTTFAHYSRLLQGPMLSVILSTIFLKFKVILRSNTLTTLCHIIKTNLSKKIYIYIKIKSTQHTKCFLPNKLRKSHFLISLKDT